jgi:hypothetical protein
MGVQSFDQRGGMGHGGAIEDIVNAGKGLQTNGNAPRLPDGGQGIQNLK